MPSVDATGVVLFLTTVCAIVYLHISRVTTARAKSNMTWESDVIAAANKVRVARCVAAGAALGIILNVSFAASLRIDTHQDDQPPATFAPVLAKNAALVLVGLLLALVTVYFRDWQILKRRNAVRPKNTHKHGHCSCCE